MHKPSRRWPTQSSETLTARHNKLVIETSTDTRPQYQANSPDGSRNSRAAISPDTSNFRRPCCQPLSDNETGSMNLAKHQTFPANLFHAYDPTTNHGDYGLNISDGGPLSNASSSSTTHKALDACSSTYQSSHNGSLPSLTSQGTNTSSVSADGCPSHWQSHNTFRLADSNLKTGPLMPTSIPLASRVASEALAPVSSASTQSIKTSEINTKLPLAALLRAPQQMDP